MHHERDIEKFAVRFRDRVSRFLDRMLGCRTLHNDPYERARRRALGRKPFLRTDGRYMWREEVYDRSNFH